MISPLRHLFGPRRDIVASAVEDILRAQGWDVQREPIVASMRPDIVARSPKGELYVMDVKQGDAAANLGAVAQVESLRNAVTDAWGASAKGVLMVAGTPPPHLQEMLRGRMSRSCPLNRTIWRRCESHWTVQASSRRSPRPTRQLRPRLPPHRVHRT